MLPVALGKRDRILVFLPMSEPTREDLLWRFGKADDPEIEARQERIVDVLLELNPRMRQQIIEKTRLAAARDALRRVLARRQLTPSKDDDVRIETCTDLAILERWHDRAVTAISVSDALG